MNILLALASGAAVMLISLKRPSRGLANRIGSYLRPRPQPVSSPALTPPRALRAGLSWSRSEMLVRHSVATLLGMFAGLLFAQGDLFITGPGRSAIPLAALGAGSGWLVFGMWLSRRAEQRAHRLRFELPVACDAIALGLIAGESVPESVDAYTRRADGVCASELRTALADHSAGRSTEEALHQASSSTADPEAARLYNLLEHAHVAGGRVADSLAELASDFRASLARDVTAESGKRALATYGPVLALMVPVALFFLLYPTLLGLRELAGQP